MTRLLDGLNAPQRDAVRHVDGPLLVLAGPGSGKTRVITHRIAHLIEEAQVDPASILALTFTNKAADEMKHRLARLVPTARVFAGTFHRLCARLLRRYGRLVGLSDGFSILDPSDVESQIKTVMKEKGHDVTHLPPGGVQRRISALKNDLVTPEEFADKAGDYFDRLVAELYPLIRERTLAQNAVDFDDLLLLTATLLREHPDVRQRLDQQYRYVLVDEYQDTNLAQYAIARGLSVDVPNLCATGDPDQSIYSWRGANIANILNFEEDFPGARVVRLEQNYRSTGHILAVADHVIRHNVHRKHKELTTDRGEGLPVRITCHRDDGAEARHVAEAIRDAVDSGTRSLRDFAVFVRTSGLSRPLEQAFRGSNIPYQMIGGYSFFERREVRDLLAYVRLLINPRDQAAWVRAVKTPPKGIGDTTIQRVLAYAAERGYSPMDACRQADDIPTLRKKQRATLRDLVILFDELGDAVELSPVAGLSKIVEEIGYREYLEAAAAKDEDDDPTIIVEEMIAAAQSFQLETPDAALVDYLETLSLASDADRRDDERDCVTIMTLHAAKGLEFPVVFIVAFEDKLLPHERAVEERGEEEERRLFFVGVTRAQESLSISYVRHRLFQGNRLFSSPSPFLFELPPEHIDRQDVVAPAPYESRTDEEINQESGWEEPAIPVYRGTREPSVSDRYHKGMWVRHAQYGDGVILQIEGVGEARKATIQFDAVGAKRFVLSKAALEPVSS